MQEQKNALTLGLIVLSGLHYPARGFRLGFHFCEGSANRLCTRESRGIKWAFYA